jgi:hypothetical protein
MPERHVHEHDLSEPTGLRYERPGRSGRDQPVEQRHGAIRDPRDGVREVGGPGHRMLVHRPAAFGEPSADSAVVCVATARPRRVVDALGDDDVDLRHSGRR